MEIQSFDELNLLGMIPLPSLEDYLQAAVLSPRMEGQVIILEEDHMVLGVIRKSVWACDMLVIGILMLSAQQASVGEDWLQYRGPHLDGTTTDKVLLRNWQPEGPPRIWKTETPLGFSSFSLMAGKAFTLVGRLDQDGVLREVAIALDANTGKELWSFPMCPAKYDGGGDSGTDDNEGGDGPRSTPTLDGNRVYVYDSQINLYCLNMDDGKLLWKKSVVDDFAGRNIRWQSSMSPLIDGDLLYLQGGGPSQSFIALNKVTGEVVWKSLDEEMTHATPVPATIHGIHQIIFFAQSGLVAVDAKNGAKLWNYPFPYKISTAASPIVSGDLVYCSAGYGVGAGLCKIKKTDTGLVAEEVWRKPNQLFNHWSTPVCLNGYLYGMFSFKDHGKGPVKCVKLATGKEMWSKDGFGPGNVIYAGDLIVALSDKGEVVLIEATPQAYKELARADVVDGKCWSTPTLSNGHLFVRSTKEAVCLDVSKAQ
jgi:outer membrane protein assembly factor BamB